MRKFDSDEWLVIGSFVFAAALLVGFVYGYAHNITLLIHPSSMGGGTIETILRCVGILLLPLGAILGYVS